jgi:hypothetical protein
VVSVNQNDTIHNFSGHGELDLYNGSLTLVDSVTAGKIVVEFNQRLTIVGTVKNIGTITVMPGGTLDIQGVLNNAGTINFIGGFTHGGNHQSFITGGGILNNTGLLTKSGTLTTAAPYETINDLGGRIQVTGGTLNIHGGTSLGGNYYVAPGCTLELSGGGDRTISGTFTASGGGLVTINTLSHKLLVADAGATFNFPPGMLQILGGNIYAATRGNHPTLKNVGIITLPKGSTGYVLMIDGVHLVDAGGYFVKQGASHVVLQDGGTLVY